MKNHDIKRIFKIAKKFTKVCIEYQTESFDSWFICGKLTDFEIQRPAFASGYNYHRLADIKLTFDKKVYWAYGLEKFADTFVGLYGIGNENQTVFLRILPEDKSSEFV